VQPKLHVSDEVLKFPLPPPPPVGAGLQPPSQSSTCTYLCLIILSIVRVGCAKFSFKKTFTLHLIMTQRWGSPTCEKHQIFNAAVIWSLGMVICNHINNSLMAHLVTTKVIQDQHVTQWYPYWIFFSRRQHTALSLSVLQLLMGLLQ